MSNISKGIAAGDVRDRFEVDRLESDDARFRDLFEMHRGKLVQAVRSRLNIMEVAEDVVSVAFVRAFERRHSFRGESSFYTWVYSIAMNEMTRRQRRYRVMKQGPITERVAETTMETAVDARNAIDSTPAVREILDRLPRHYRIVLTKRLVDGDSVHEISKSERIPVGTVLSRIFNAKRLLRRQWNETTFDLRRVEAMWETMTAK